MRTNGQPKVFEHLFTKARDRLNIERYKVTECQ